ncbi:MAG TPA: phosphoenolpyruvate--protein phosphotransferase [Candidatus Omnitrophota bacterium]|nr:phosphoenolpyruvate--protein phosphotransferase [Candidatus Omnitrophota bacterium]HPS36863.1 phosphoenolpyruvate--protein phosphotransferase [Candidatus Omnitrophota bacterium]
MINKEARYKGLPLSPGVAFARVCLFNERRHQNLPVRDVSVKEISKEKERVRKAVSLVKDRLEELIASVKDKVGPAEAEIFAAQKMILKDPALEKLIAEHIETRNFNAEKAVISSLDFFESQLAKMDNEYIRERASDIGEVKRRLLDVLANLNPSFQCASESFCQRGKNRIVIAEELTPSLTMELNTDFIRGFVTERGGGASHAAILARALKIPAVSGIPNIHDRMFCGTDVLINGDTGEVVLWPTEKTLSQYPELKLPPPEVLKAENPISGLKVMANLNRAAKVQEVLDQKAEGIGLYRTEFEFFAAGKILSEEEQLERYIAVLKAMRGKPVYFRMLDIGGDKNADFLKLPTERNPYLGFRGSRFLLGHRNLFRAQARALAKASQYGRVYVMYPMVIDLDQFLQLKKAFLEETADIPSGEIKHGMMFEVPSACLDAEELFRHVDFGSIGTNDLIQYMFAVDRDNEAVAYDHHPDRKVFWALLRHVAHAARKHRKPLSVCGELAGNPGYARRLVGEGIHTVSVAASMITALRIALKNKPEHREPKLPRNALQNIRKKSKR